MRMTVLIENDESPTRDDLIAEFGLSLLFELDDTLVLFDTGSTGAFVDNAARLGVDLASVDLAVLSHHHFDHGGGLARFFELNNHAPVYLRRAERADRVFRFLGKRRSVGIDLELFDRFPHRFVEITETTEITPGVTLLTDVGTDHPRPRGNRRLFVRKATGDRPDDFDHELIMVLNDNDGMVVVTGCSHSGILNMVDAAADRFPDSKIRSVIGGFHLIGLPFYNSMAASRREVEELGRSIHQRCAGPVFTGHCTGDKSYRVLKGVLGDQLRPFPTGTQTEI